MGSPATLPADFFSKPQNQQAAPQSTPQSSPDTLPADFFTKQATQSAPQADPASESQMFEATTGGVNASHRYDASSNSTVPMERSTVGDIVQGAKDSGIAHLAQDAVNAPTSADEHVALNVTGPGGLIALRQAKNLVKSAGSLMKSTGEQFPQAIQDFQRTVNEFKRGDYRNAASSAASTASDAVGIFSPAQSTQAGMARELSEGARPGGNLATPLTRQILDAGTAVAGEGLGAGEAAGDLADAATQTAGKVASKIKELPSKAVETAQDIKPEWLTKRAETPSPQHGAPVKVESPLDGPTVGKQLGGKDLSQEALDALQDHVGDKIPVGSTAKNRLTAAVEPVTKAISDTASKMNNLVRDAHSFTTSVAQDNVFGEGTLNTAIDQIKNNLPPSVRENLSGDIDAVIQDADKALNSTSPAEVLEARRKLGNSIDWDRIERNPSTPAEAQNVAKAKVYRALGDKIHAEIPETSELDKVMQPNLELRSHLQSKVGERLVDDPHAATVEAESEFKKGKTQIENQVHNDQVAKNWGRIKTSLLVAGVSGGVIHTLGKLIGE
jgi:hypothetical protein